MHDSSEGTQRDKHTCQARHIVHCGCARQIVLRARTCAVRIHKNVPCRHPFETTLLEKSVTILNTFGQVPGSA